MMGMLLAAASGLIVLDVGISECLNCCSATPTLTGRDQLLAVCAVEI